MSEKGFRNIATLLLAAGSSKRFGARNKLLELVEGQPLVRRTARKLLDAGLGELHVITGYDSVSVEAALEGLPCVFVRNANYEKGMGSSLACGIRFLSRGNLSGILICLADLPALEVDDVLAVLKRFEECQKTRIVVPEHEGRRGHPVCFPIRCCEALENLSGDRGAKRVIENDTFPIAVVLRGENGCVRDMDTPVSGS